MLPFIDYMVSSGFDFHVAVTTMDMSGGGEKGAFVGSPKVLTRTTPNLRQAFVQNITRGTTGSDLSRGLEAVESALSDDSLAGRNAGFWRADAMFAIIFLSDEEDGSANSSQHYIDFLDQKKPLFPGGSRGWIANSIVVPELNGECRTYNQFASPGYRFMDTSTNSGGVIESICKADLVQASASIRARIVEQLTQYHLKREPDVSSIKVTINGVSIPNDPGNGWTYVAQGYTIVFHGSAVPPVGANVQINYLPKITK
jgi:hypothetical protein